MIRWQRNLTRGVLALSLVVGLGGPALAKSGPSEKHDKLDKILKSRAGKGGTSRVIITLKSGSDPSSDVRKLGGRLGRKLGLINGQVVELPNAVIRKLADLSFVESVHYDRPTGGEMNRVAVATGARAAQLTYGYTGAGVGVAVIDSGVTNWHDDLTYPGYSSAVRVKNGQRVPAFVDFVNGRTAPYDDNGHGTHVAGIIAGNGADSLGVRAGIAPSAHIVSLKVLDDRGRGVISDVIAALDWVVANKAAYNVRVVNLSVGAAVTESYKTDPLTLAAKRAVDAGIVVVTAAGNLGKNADGQTQYGAITAPGNAPWVLTVGAYSHEGTVVRTDDVMAGYSSRGPTAIDFQAKPDLVAPGTGIVSLSSASSTMYYSKPQYLLKGSFGGGYKPYLSLTGTSMAAPVVSGTVALMLQANPSLTPNMVKAILQYTAQIYPSYNALTQGAGFLNAQGAVQLARFFRTAQGGSRLTMPSEWGRQVIWGNHRITRWRHPPERERLPAGHHVGFRLRPRRRQHRVGHAAARRQHRVGHRRPAERRQPGVGHGSRPAPATTWCGAPTGPTTISCGARCSATTTSCGARIAAAAGIATTSSGAPRSLPTTWCGARRWPPTTWCGARRSPATTWCGARAATSTIWSGARRPKTTT